MLAAVEWPSKTADINVKRDHHRKSQQGGCNPQSSATTVQWKQQIQQNQNNKQGRNCEPQADQEQNHENDKHLNQGEAWSAGFLDLAIHDGVRMTPNDYELSDGRSKVEACTACRGAQ